MSSTASSRRAPRRARARAPCAAAAAAPTRRAPPCPTARPWSRAPRRAPCAEHQPAGGGVPRLGRVFDAQGGRRARLARREEGRARDAHVRPPSPFPVMAVVPDGGAGGRAAVAACGHCAPARRRVFGARSAPAPCAAVPQVLPPRGRRHHPDLLRQAGLQVAHRGRPALGAAPATAGRLLGETYSHVPAIILAHKRTRCHRAMDGVWV